MKKIKKYKNLILIILLVSVLFGVNKIYSIYKEANPDWKYDEVEIEKKDLRKIIDVDGEVMADYEINLASEIPGIISKIYVKEGGYVKKGQLLMKLKDTDYRNQINSAYVNQRINEASYEKTKNPNQNLELDIKKIEENKEIISDDIKKIKIDLKNEIDFVDSFLTNILRQDVDDYFDHTEFSDGIYSPTFTYRIKSKIEISRLEEERKSLSQKFKEYKDGSKSIKNAEYILISFEKMIYDLYKNSHDFLGLSDRELEAKTNYLSNLKNQVSAKKTKIASLATSLDQLEKRLNNTKTDVAKIENIVNPADLRLAKERIKAARVQTHSAYTQLQKTYIRATKSGIVAKVYSEDGEYAGPSQPLIKIFSKSKYLEMNVPEVDLGKIKKDGEVEIKLDAFKNKIFKGKIDFVYPEKIEKFGIIYYRVKVLFDKKDLKKENILSGMSATIIIPFKVKKDIWALSRDVVKKDGDNYFVYTLKENNAWDESRFLKQKIEAGFVGDDFVEVKNKKDFNDIKILKIENEK